MASDFTHAPGTHRSKLALFLAPTAALAAGALLALRMHFQPPTVPPYAIAPGSGDSSETVSEEGTARDGEGFALDLQPSGPVTGAIAARAFLLRGDDVRPWDPPFEVSRDGTVRIAGAVHTLFAGVPDGPWEVAVAVGRPEVLPTAPRDVLHARDADPDASSAAFRLVRTRIVLVR